MELKLVYGIETRPRPLSPSPCCVLIVPFMELKPKSSIEKTTCLSCLNRTFYGIETIERTPATRSDPGVLIVPFMELKLAAMMSSKKRSGSLNRTFYGIETLLKH